MESLNILYWGDESSSDNVTDCVIDSSKASYAPPCRSWTDQTDYSVFVNASPSGLYDSPMSGGTGWSMDVWKQTGDELPKLKTFNP